MATTVNKVIGTSGDYTTLQAWEDACPANLVSSDQIWRGLCKNQEFVSSSIVLNISGITTDVNRYLEITTDTGASFMDNANVRTNALRYNASNGAAIRFTGAYSGAVTNTVNYTRISKLQICGTGNHSSAITTASAITNIENCIYEAPRFLGAIVSTGSGTFTNCLGVNTYSGNATHAHDISYLTTRNCTFVSINNATNGVRAQYGTFQLHNSYVGNCTTARTGNSTPTYTTNASSVASPPSGWTGNIPFSTATFENITSGTHDFRLKAGSGLIGIGTDFTTDVPNDITGTARTSTWDIGAWEDVSGGGGPTYTLTASAGSFSLTGNAANLTAIRKITAATASVSLTGNGAGLSANRKLLAATGSYTLTGNSTGLVAQRKLLATTRAYVLTGNSAGLTAQRKLLASVGTFTLTGIAANLTYTPISGATYTLTASSGAFVLTGNAAGLRAQRKIVASQGTFTFTGNAAGLSAQRKLSATSRTFTFTGNALNLKASRKLLASVSTFIFTGNSANLSRSKVLTASTGSFTFSGNNANFVSHRVITISSGQFIFTGQNTRLLYTSIGGFGGPESPPIRITRELHLTLNR